MQDYNITALSKSLLRINDSNSRAIIQWGLLCSILQCFIDSPLFNRMQFAIAVIWQRILIAMAERIRAIDPQQCRTRKH